MRWAIDINHRLVAAIQESVRDKIGSVKNIDFGCLPGECRGENSSGTDAGPGQKQP